MLARIDPRRNDFRDVPARDVPYINSRNNSDWGGKGMVGMRMTPHLAFEAGYTDFGGTPTDVERALRARTKTFTAYGVGIMPVGPLQIFAKAGPTRIESTGRINGTYFDDQERKITYGAGLQLAQRRWVVRTEYEKFGSGSFGNLNTVSLGFRLSFNPRYAALAKTR